MAQTHIYTDTINNLPYGYHLKFEVICYGAGSGSTSTTVTNGKHITRIGKVKQSVDYPVGDVKMGGLNFEVRDYDGEVSTNWDPYNRDAIEVRYWISYDSGTTWEALFFGFVRKDQLTRTDKDDTATHLQRWGFSAYHVMDPLKELQTTIFSSTITPVATVTVPEYHTDEKGAPVQVRTYTNAQFATILSLLEHIVDDKVPFIPGLSVSPSTTSVDYSLVEAVGYNDNTAATYSFEKLCLLFEAPSLTPWPFGTAVTTKGFFGAGGGSAGAYGMKNYAKILSAVCQSLGVIPIPRLTNSSGTIGFTLYLVPRFPTSPAAVTTEPSPLISRKLSAVPYVQGGQIKLAGHPMAIGYSYGGVNKGNQVTMQAIHATSPDIGVDPYLWGDSVWQGDGTYDDSGEENMSQNTNANTAQLFAYTGSGIVNVHKFKHLTGQSLHETAGIGYYGVAESLFEILLDNSGSFGYYRYVREAQTRRYRSLKGADIWDVRLLKSLAIGGSTYLIDSIERDPLKNEMSITASKVA